MIIGAAQLNPVKGDIEANIDTHCHVAEMAAAMGVELLVFPELSLTGYEPSLAVQLAMHKHDPRIAPIQNTVNRLGIQVGAGVPLKEDRGVLIGLPFFRPHKEIVWYAKQFLHEDELPFFVRGKEAVLLSYPNEKIAPAICYELSVPAHAKMAADCQATVYLISAVKSVKGTERAWERCREIAMQHSMVTLFCNSVGTADGERCGGRSSIWDSAGNLKAHLDETSETILAYDTRTGQTQTLLL